MTIKRRTALLAAAALAAAIATANAQPGPGGGPRGPGGGPGMMGWGEGMMMGPGMMGRGRYNRMCGPGAAGFAEWRIERVEKTLQLTEAQRPKFEDFKAASSKAAETMRAACPDEIPAAMPGRMAAMEKRMETMLAAIKTVRPALDAFYATLTDDQKARLESDRGRGRYWRWRDRW